MCWLWQKGYIQLEVFAKPEGLGKPARGGDWGFFGMRYDVLVWYAEAGDRFSEISCESVEWVDRGLFDWHPVCTPLRERQNGENECDCGIFCTGIETVLCKNAKRRKKNCKKIHRETGRYVKIDGAYTLEPTFGKFQL